MTRVRLPNRRPGETFEFRHAYPGLWPLIVTATIGRNPEDGRIMEVFVNLVRTEESTWGGTDKQINVDAHDAAVILSIALQHGVDIDEIGHALLHGEDGVAHGFIGALIDAVKALEPIP